MFLDLSKGQYELNTLITKWNKKKTKNPTVFLNIGRRFKGRVRRVLDFEVPLNEDDNQEKDDESVKAEENNNLSSGQDSDEDYSAEKYLLYPKIFPPIFLKHYIKALQMVETLKVWLVKVLLLDQRPITRVWSFSRKFDFQRSQMASMVLHRASTRFMSSFKPYITNLLSQ